MCPPVTFFCMNPFVDVRLDGRKIHTVLGFVLCRSPRVGVLQIIKLLISV